MPARQPVTNTSDDENDNEDVPMTPERRKFLAEMDASDKKVQDEYDKRAQQRLREEQDYTVSPEVEKRLRQQEEDDKFRRAAERAFGENRGENRYAKGGKVKSTKRRGDGCCTKGKTKGRFV
jgi:hypothetical protein